MKARGLPMATPAPLWSFCPRAPMTKAPSSQLPAPTKHAESHSSGISPAPLPRPMENFAPLLSKSPFLHSGMKMQKPGPQYPPRT